MKTRYLVVVLILATIAFSRPAQAARICDSTSVNIHLASIHKQPGRLQEFNPGVGLECDIPPLLDGRLVVWNSAGVLENSFKKPSFYASTGADLVLALRSLPGARAGVFFSALTGYEQQGYQYVRPAGGLRLVLPIVAKAQLMVLLFPPYGSVNPLVAHVGISFSVGG